MVTAIRPPLAPKSTTAREIPLFAEQYLSPPHPSPNDWSHPGPNRPNEGTNSPKVLYWVLFPLDPYLNPMQLGAFSVSLTVKDLAASRAFYEKLGFDAMGGNPEHGYLIMKNGDVVIGIFQGMFEKNILTFNPGWDQNAQPTESFQDVREIQAQLKTEGIAFEVEADASTTGPAHFIIVDPDGNTIMFDQHR